MHTARLGIILLGLYFLVQGVLLLGGSIATSLRLDPTGIVPRLELVAGQWAFYAPYLGCGVLLVLLASPAARALAPAESLPESARFRAWLALGITLIGVYFAVESGAALALGTFVASLPERADAAPPRSSHLAARSVHFAISVAVVVFARPLARLLWRAA